MTAVLTSPVLLTEQERTTTTKSDFKGLRLLCDDRQAVANL